MRRCDFLKALFFAHLLLKWWRQRFSGPVKKTLVKNFEWFILSWLVLAYDHLVRSFTSCSKEHIMSWRMLSLFYAEKAAGTNIDETFSHKALIDAFFLRLRCLKVTHRCIFAVRKNSSFFTLDFIFFNSSSTANMLINCKNIDFN